MKKPLRIVTTLFAALLTAACSTAPASQAGRGGESYFVTVAFTAQTDGRITDVEIVRTDAPKEIQAAALRAAQKWHAKPGPVARAKRTLVFKLD